MKLLLLFFIFVSCSFFAQQEIYKNYTVEDGLPSSEVHFSLQDSKGYMWFATDAGVSRFNGYEFENFTTENGLTDNTIFKIIEDSKGRIWFAPFNGRFCYYENKSIIEYKYDLKEQAPIRMDKLINFYVDKKNNIWVFTERGGYKINSEGVKKLLEKTKSNEITIRSFKVDSLQYFYSLPTSMIKLVDSYSIKVKLGLDTIFYEDTVHIYNFLKKIENLHDNYVLRVLSSSIDQILFDNNVDNKLYVYDIHGVVVKKNVYDFNLVKNKSLVFTKFIDNYLWISLREEGVYKCKLEKGKVEVVDHYFSSSSITSITIDNELGYWFTSLTNGVYYLPNDNVKIKDFNNSKIYQLETDTINQVLFLNLRKGVVIYNGNNKEFIDNFKNDFGSYKVYFDYGIKALVWGGINLDGKSELRYYKNSQISRSKKKFNYSIVFKAIEMAEDTIYAVDSEGIKVCAPGYEYFSTLDSNAPKMWCTSLIKLKEEVWIGTNKGIRIYNNQKIKTPFSKDANLSSAITCIERLNDSVFLIGTKNKGLLFIKNRKVDKVFNENNGLINNLIRSIHVDNRGTIWVGTSKGVSRLSYRNKNNFRIYNLTKKQGLSSEEITSIKSLKDTIYIGTAKGLLSLNRNNIVINENAPKVSIIDLKINSKSKNKDSLAFLTYKDNNISIAYLGVNYRSKGKINYKYRLIGIGLDTNWVLTQSRFVQYSLLPSGSYVFEVNAENEDGYWSNSTQMNFTIYPPFWKTWWFISILLLSFSALLLWIVSLYFKRREKTLIEEKEKSEIERKMIELELKALRSQMNPHFIFNILNSIQHYMLQNNFKETNRYLTQFAKLIRTVLNLSEKNIITIGEEIEMLRLYMSLEKMRFENGFDYEIILGEEVDEDYDEIPSMLIQPYVENAIWHGLMNKKSKGKISIFIDVEDEYLCCIIEDNGIGLQKAKEIKAKRKQMKHKSIGMRVTKDRLDLLNDNSEVSVKIIDRSIANLNETGTRIEIKIPYNNI